MSPAEKAHALLEIVTRAQVEEMSPLQRRRFAALCRRVADFAEPQMSQPLPKSGVLAELRTERAP